MNHRTMTSEFVTAEYYNDLLEKYFFAVKDCNILLREKSEATATIAHLQSELAVLRPPKPMFEVGQIVVLRCGDSREMAFTVRWKRFQAGHWQYSNRRSDIDGDWVNENRLRGLTKEECGTQVHCKAT